VSTMMKILCLLAFFLVFAAMSGNNGGVSDAAATTADGEAVFKSVCTRCHTSSRICGNLGRDASWWERTATRMRSNGAPLEAKDIADVAAFLSAQAPGSSPVCK